MLFACSPHRSAVLGYTVLTAEVKILCLKSSEKNLVAKLNTEIKYLSVVFQFPGKEITLNFTQYDKMFTMKQRGASETRQIK